MPLRLLATAAAALVLTGCAGNDAETAAAQCEARWQAAADESDVDAVHDQLHLAFTACTDYDQWVATSERFPAELLEGFTPESFVDVGCEEPDLVGTPVCDTRP